MMEPFPTLAKVFSLVIRERQRSIRKDQFPVFESIMAVNASFASNGSRSFNRGKQGRRDMYFCTHCKVKGYSRERCFKLIGYPSNFKPKQKNMSGQGSFDGARSIKVLPFLVIIPIWRLIFLSL